MTTADECLMCGIYSHRIYWNMLLWEKWHGERLLPTTVAKIQIQIYWSPPAIKGQKPPVIGPWRMRTLTYGWSWIRGGAIQPHAWAPPGQRCLRTRWRALRRRRGARQPGAGLAPAKMTTNGGGGAPRVEAPFPPAVSQPVNFFCFCFYFYWQFNFINNLIY